MSLLVSTKIYYTHFSRPRASVTVTTNLHVVLVPNNNLDMLSLYTAISRYAFDEREPFVAICGNSHRNEEEKEAVKGTQ